MKKNVNGKNRSLRLALNRETIKILDNPSLLGFAGATGGQSASQCAAKCVELYVVATTECPTTSATC